MLLAALLATVGLAVVAPPAQAATQAVMMEGYAYSPSTLSVHVGDTVTWTNHDQAPHDVTTTSAPVAIKSQLLSTGQSFSYTFSTAGTYSYYCSIHPDMRAQVVVQPAPAAAAPVATNVAPKTTAKSAAPKSSSAAVAQAPVVAQPASSSMAMPAAPAASPVPAEQPEQPAVAASAAPVTSTSLDPMLVVAGIAAGIAVLCLLVLGSRRQT